jgi:RNase P protein component
MAPNAREDNERPTRPETEQIRVPRVRMTARKSVAGTVPRREIRRLVIEAHRQEQQQQQQQTAQQNEQASTSEETTAAGGTTETKVVVK